MIARTQEGKSAEALRANVGAVAWSIYDSKLTPVSELAYVTTQFDLASSPDFVAEPPLGGLRGNVRCSCKVHWKARSELPISVN